MEAARRLETTQSFVRGIVPDRCRSPWSSKWRPDMSSAPPAIAIGALESAISFDREIPLALQELRLPVVAINPDNAPTDTASMRRHGVEVVFMSGVGHFLLMEDPERFNRVLGTVIDKLVR